MRLVRDEDAVGLAQLLENPIVPVGSEMLLPHLLLGRATTPEARLQGMLQYHWGLRSNFSPSQWTLGLAVFLDGELVGSQSIRTQDFALTREVKTGSYLSREVQGQGVGTRMRALTLEFALGRLNAQWATSGYMEGNAASKRVSEKLGYRDDGFAMEAYHGRTIRNNRVRLSQLHWQASRPSWLNEAEFSGLGPCLPLLGA